MNGVELVESIRRGQAAPPSGIATLGLDRTHEWIEQLGSGRTVLRWEVGDAHHNLEGAVICSWTAAIGDQAIFFASNTLCADGEGTRMADLHLSCVENITAGTVIVDAVVDRRVGDRMFCHCDFRAPDDRLLARVTAVIDVVR